MRRMVVVALALLFTMAAWAQNSSGCSCGTNPPGRPAKRTMVPYAQAPEDLRPFSKFTKPYWENYTDLVEYNGAARDIPDPDLSTLNEIRIGFIGPLYNHPEQAFGQRMLHGAQLAIDQANARGGYCGKPFKLMLHNDSAIWGASSNEVIKMAYDDKVWAMFGSISGDTTHIALRVSLKAEVPMVNSAATDPTIPETIIPWYLSDLQDDRMQGYTIARRLYTELGLKRAAILRVNSRYGRFGVLKFRDASRRLGHPTVIEQKFMPGDTDFHRQLRVIKDSRVDSIVLWTDQAEAAEILKEMKELGMKQHVIGSHRTIGDELLEKAAAAAEGYEAVFPYDPTRSDPGWKQFNADYDATYHERPDHFAALAYDAMQVLLNSICRAGLNRGRIRDALTGVEHHDGVTGKIVFDPNCKNISPLFLATVKNGTIEYRRATMEKTAAPAESVGAAPSGQSEPMGAAPLSRSDRVRTTTSAQPYARVGEDGVQYAGPALADSTADLRIAVFGPHADQLVNSPEIVAALDEANRGGRRLSLIGISSEGPWGKASTRLVDTIYKDHVLGLIALDRNSSHLAEQLAVKAFLPLIAVSSDKTLTSVNIPWIFRLPPDVPSTDVPSTTTDRVPRPSSTARLEQAVRCFTDALTKAGPNPERIRDLLASGTLIAGIRFESTGEPK